MRFFLVSLFLAWPTLAGLQSVYDKTFSFEAHFKQTYWNKLFDRTDTSEGTLSYQKPGKMRWDYQTPHPKSFILNKNTLWMVETEDKIAYINRCFQSDALTASLVFLGGKGRLTDQFKITTGKNKELILTPKVKNPVFEQLILVTEPKTSRVTQTTLIDSDGNKNEFKFEKSRFNHKIAAKNFEYKATKDIELLDMPGSCGAK
ncbi:MAG: outer membrane lipoprotein carrier protein LolA [Myxococcaceae bacterium]